MFCTQAFILGYRDVGEYDRRYFLLTQEFGRIEAICKSVLRPRSKLAGHLETPNFSWLELVESSRGWQITQALEEKTYPFLRTNPEALKAILKAAKFLNDFLAEDFNQAKIFSLWKEFLNKLENHLLLTSSQKVRDFDIDFLYSQFILRALDILGFLPDIFHCSNCEKELFFSDPLFYGGNFFCSNCARNKSLQGQKYSKQTFSLIKQILNQVWFRQSSLSEEIKEISNYFQIQAYQFMI